MPCVARFSSYLFRLIHEDVENVKLGIAVVSTSHQRIYFLFFQDMQIITSDTIIQLHLQVDQKRFFWEKNFCNFAITRAILHRN